MIYVNANIVRRRERGCRLREQPSVRVPKQLYMKSVISQRYSFVEVT